jgi:predicted RNA-binding Zn ribbon-like protein
LASSQARGKPVTLSQTPLEVIRAAVTGTSRMHPTQFDDAEADVVTAAVRRMRTAVDLCIDGEIEGAAAILNDVLQGSRAIANLHSHPGQPIVFAFHGRGHRPGESCVADMAASVALIIGSGREARLGRCGATKCDQVFYDTTRNASRRFCDLSCQNRAKAVAYRARQTT